MKSVQRHPHISKRFLLSHASFLLMPIPYSRRTELRESWLDPHTHPVSALLETLPPSPVRCLCQSLSKPTGGKDEEDLTPLRSNWGFAYSTAGIRFAYTQRKEQTLLVYTHTHGCRKSKGSQVQGSLSCARLARACMAI